MIQHFKLSIHGVWLACFAIGWFAISPAFATPEILGVRMGVDKERTRFVLEMSEGVQIKVFGLTGPDRLVVDLPSSDWQIPTTSSVEGVGVVKGYRFGQFDPKTSRIVLDLTGPVTIVDQFVLQPDAGYRHRLVIDLVAGTKKPADPIAGKIGASPQTAKPATQKTALKLPRPLPKPRRLTLTIAVDPGHGGRDPGNTGYSGTAEKDIVLAVSKKLRSALKKKGYNVMMTRSGDTLPTLLERVAMARAAKADLFVSIHANSNPSSKVRGASIYTLDEQASDEEAADLARRENRADAIAGVDLSTEPDDVGFVLIELSMRQTINESVRFVKELEPELKMTGKLVKNPHRFGNFRVLKAPDVPSVLVELGHLSNPQEEKWLKKNANQQKMADAIVRAVDDFFFPEERASLR